MFIKNCSRPIEKLTSKTRVVFIITFYILTETFKYGLLNSILIIPVCSLLLLMDSIFDEITPPQPKLKSLLLNLILDIYFI